MEGLGRVKHLIMISVLLSACAGIKTNQENASNPANNATGAVGLLIREAALESPSQPNYGASGTSVISTNGFVKTYVLNEPIVGKTLKVNHFDYPVIENPAVIKWIAYFTGKGRGFFSKYLARGRFFIPDIAKTLKANNMPQDLVYLAMIESGFNNSARSWAAAVGPWQFIKSTGVRHGLTVNYWLDERRETRKSTMAAISYLRELYQEFGSWELAAAGYNAGEGKVRRAMKKYRTSDFWEISRHRFFKSETKNYVPKIMAAAIIAKNPELFGFEDPFKSGVKPIYNPTTLMHLTDRGDALISDRASDDEDDDANDANDANNELTPKELGVELSKASDNDTSEDPNEKKDEVLASTKADAYDDTDEEDDDAASVLSGHSAVMTPAVYMVANPNDKIIEYEIKGPADLFSVAKASGLPYSTLKLLNPELMRWVTPPSMKTYRIKLPLSVKQRFLATYNDDNFDRKIVFFQYAAKRGDTVTGIAKRFSVLPDPIREINGMPAQALHLNPGKPILLPIPTGYKRVIAGMFDEKPRLEKRRHGKRRARRAKSGIRKKSKYVERRNFSQYTSGVTKAHAIMPAKIRTKRLAPKFATENH